MSGIIGATMLFKAAIFDLDGVLVDTARYHYLAWKRLAAELGFTFTEHDNERLKGVSRMRSLEIFLEVGNLSFCDVEMQALAARKNQWYVESISKLEPSALLPGSLSYLGFLNAGRVPVALASASKNAKAVIRQLQISDLFQYVVDANVIKRAKPDPEIFLVAANGLAVPPAACVVFEDAAAGIEAAHAAGMYAIGVGTSQTLPKADRVVPDLGHVNIRSLFV
jgi:beta-phosphoglucomutase